MSNEKTMVPYFKKKHYYFKKFPAKLAAKALRGTNKVE
jgi:hypothetical protein